jgi:hypothetical protein
MRLSARLFATATFLAISTLVAHSDPIVVLNNSQVASAVDGVVVDGVVYDVTFVANAIDSTFDVNATGAATAESELIAALNGTTAAFVALQGCCTINNFLSRTLGRSAVFLPQAFLTPTIGRTSAVSQMMARLPSSPPFPLPNLPVSFC